jgi:predicted HTH domain antitoxin
VPTITFDLPDGALSALHLSPAKFVKEMAALLWYSQGELSQSKAAEIAGTSRAEFIDELLHRRIPVVRRSDLHAVRRHARDPAPRWWRTGASRRAAPVFLCAFLFRPPGPPWRVPSRERWAEKGHFAEVFNLTDFSSWVSSSHRSE